MQLTLAHYGGIDEIGIFVLPAVLVIIVLRAVEKRAQRDRLESEDDEAEDQVVGPREDG